MPISCPKAPSEPAGATDDHEIRLLHDKGWGCDGGRSVGRPDLRRHLLPSTLTVPG